MENKLQKNISYRLQFVEIASFMASSLSNLVNNLSEGIQTIKCKYEHDDKKCETCWIKYLYCDYFLECTDFTNDLRVYKFFCVYIVTKFINKSLMKS